MPEPERLAALRNEIERSVQAYVAEFDEDLVAHAWTLVVGSSRLDWNDGRESVILVHTNVPYSTRVGLLQTALHDLLHVTPND